MLRIILVVLIVHLSGCIIIPTPEKEPYQEEQIARIHPGETTRDEIIETFGRPDVVRANNTIWIYGEERHIAYGIMIWPAPSDGFMEDYQFIVAEFEEDTVSHFELVEDMHGCTSTGICLGYGWNQRPSQRGLYSEDLIIIASKRKDDQIAKEFESVPEKCSVYIYADHRGHVAVNEINNVLINENTYGHFLQSPGKISVLTIRRPWDRRSGIIEEQFDCGENTLLFIHLSDSTNWGWSKLKRTIRQVEYLEGTKSIKDRDLVIF